ncbi:MAG: cbb3-type cytochrome oxidase assembly protein CcoS [Phycisphaerales bacterium]|nr:cbb3-type cytochrome oxidase assembly protein CcoS [Phycisphaerales bacterium]
MSVVYIMIPIALCLAALGVAAFIIAAKNGQFDDLDTPALRAIFDDDETPPDIKKEKNITKEDDI